MPATNEEFIKKAFQAGLTEDQVRAAVAERNSLNATKMKEPVKEKNALQKTSEFLLPIATKTANTIGTFVPGTGWKQATDSANTALDMNRRLMEAAKKETDPQKKAFLLNAAKSSQENISGVTQDTVQSMQDNSGLTDEDLKKGGLNARLGFGSALEVGSYLTPQVKAANGATATGRVINAGLTGGAAGTMAGSAKATQADTLGGAGKDLLVGSTVGTAAGVASQSLAEGLKALKNSKAVTAMKDSFKSMGRSINDFSGGNAERATSEMFGLNKSNGIVKNFRIEKGKKLQEEALKYAPEVFGQTDDEVLANIAKVKEGTGVAIESATKNLPSVNISQMDDQVIKMANESKRIGKPEQAKEIIEYWEKIKSGNLRDPATGKFRNKGVISAFESWRLKTAFDENLWTEAGKSKNITAMSAAEAKVREAASNFFRKNLRTDKTVESLFDKYQTLSAMEGSMYNKLGSAPGMPRLKAFSILTQGADNLTSGTRDHGYLQKAINDYLKKASVAQKEKIIKDPNLLMQLLTQMSQQPKRGNVIGGSTTAGMGALERASEQSQSSQVR